MTTAQASLREVVVAGVGMTAFGKFLDRSIKSLVAESVQAAIKDSGMGDSDKGIDTIYYANTASGILQGQHSVRGQHAMREAGLNGIPLINVENACASGSTALNQAWLAVASGYVDVALAVGAEKLYHPVKALTFAAMGSALDQDRLMEIFSHAAVTKGFASRPGGALIASSFQSCAVSCSCRCQFAGGRGAIYRHHGLHPNRR